MQKEILFKITVAGDGGVGKTTLLHYYINGEFLENASMTIGVEFFDKELIINNKTYKVMFWDVGGQERFRDLHQAYVGGSMGAIYMFDLSRISTLNSIDRWLEMLRSASGDIPILLVGSKYDLNITKAKKRLPSLRRSISSPSKGMFFCAMFSRFG